MSAEMIETARAALSDTEQTVYEVPSGHRAVVQNVVVANVAGAGVAVSIWTTDADDSPEEPYHLAKSSGVDAGDALTIAERVHLHAGDKIMAEASEDAAAVITVSLLEFEEPGE